MRTLFPTRRAALLAASASLLDRAWAASAEDIATSFPRKPIRLIVPFPAGSTGDVRARPVAQWLSSAWQQPMFVDNRPGATGTLGTDAVAKATPDGYTIGLIGPAAMAILPHLTRLPFDPLRDLVPVSKFVDGPILLVANPKAPYDTVEQLVRYSRAHPGEVKVAGFGVASINHLAALQIAKATGADLTHVPYQGGPQQVVDTISGQVPLLLDYYTVLAPHLASGALKPLAVTADRRTPGAPDVATFTELGYPGLTITAWAGVVAPAGTPPAVVRKLSDGFVQALAVPEIRDRFAASGGDAAGSSPEAFAAFVREEHDRWGRVIREGGVKLE